MSKLFDKLSTPVQILLVAIAFFTLVRAMVGVATMSQSGDKTNEHAAQWNKTYANFAELGEDAALFCELSEKAPESVQAEMAAKNYFQALKLLKADLPDASRSVELLPQTKRELLATCTK